MALCFELTAEQEQLCGVVRRFARERVAPRAEELNERRRFPADLVREMGAMGLFGLPFPQLAASGLTQAGAGSDAAAPPGP